jgi:hypothetical protein
MAGVVGRCRRFEVAGKARSVRQRYFFDLASQKHAAMLLQMPNEVGALHAAGLIGSRMTDLP